MLSSIRSGMYITNLFALQTLLEPPTADRRSLLPRFEVRNA